MKKILIPTDFSNNAKQAAKVGAFLARQVGAKVVLLHVNTAVAYTPPLPDYSVPQAFDWEAYEENAREALLALEKDLSQQADFAALSFEKRVEEGLLHQAIRQVVEEEGIDIVVMGTKGATGAVEFFIGSNTEKVIRTAPCPVLAVPENSGDFEVKSVLVPTTLRPDQVYVFEWLAEWQKYFSFTVSLLYLNDPLGLGKNKVIEEKAREMGKGAGLRNYRILIEGNTFNEEAAILEVAHEQHVDLIAMGTHQRKGLSHLLFGSLTEDMANHSDIPVLSIPLKK